jgi:SulP family sulfate permease
MSLHSRSPTNELSLKGKQLTTEQVVDLLNRRSNSKAADEISFNIDAVDYNQVSVLDLSYNKLTRVPAEVIKKNFPYLQILKLDNNPRILPQYFNDVLQVAQEYNALDLSIDGLTDENVIKLQLTNPNLNILNSHLEDGNQSEHDIGLTIGSSQKPALEKEQYILEIGQFFGRVRLMLKAKLEQLNKDKEHAIKQAERRGGIIQSVSPTSSSTGLLHMDSTSTLTLEKFQSFYDELIQTVRNSLDQQDEDQRVALVHQAKVYIYHQYLDLLYKVGARVAREKHEILEQSRPKTTIVHDEDMTVTFSHDNMPSSPAHTDDKDITIEFSLADIKQQAKLMRRDFVNTNVLDWDKLHHRSAPSSPTDLNADDDHIPSTFVINDDEHIAKEYKIGGVLFRSKESRANMAAVPVWKRVFLFIAQFLPIIEWLPRYFKKDVILQNLKGDILAGVTVAIVIIPQGIAYALVAGLPPIYGLYTCFIPTLLYPFFGTSRQLAPGPSAIVSLLLSSAITTLNPNTEEEYVNYAILLALLSGGIYFLLGFFRMGFLVNFMSKPVISGFTSASAIAIALTQVKYVLGIHPDSTPGTQIYWSLYVLGKAIFTPTYTGHDEGIHWPTVGISILFIVMLLWFTYGFIPLGKRRRFYPGHIVPGQLVVIMFSLILFYLMSLGYQGGTGHDVFGINILGSINAGLPAPGIPTFQHFVIDSYNSSETLAPGEVTEEPLQMLSRSAFRLMSNIPQPDESGPSVIGHFEGSSVIDINTFFSCLLISITVVIVGFSEAYSVGKFYANLNNYRVDPNQELIALGICCTIAGFFQAYPSSTSFSRSAVNAQVGAKTQMATMVTGLMMFLVLTVITPLFYYLPKPLLGSLIILAVAKLVDFRTVRMTWNTKRRDTVMLGVSFFSTLFLGVEWGIVTAVFMSLALVIFRSARPRFVEVGRLPGTIDYASIKRYPSAVTIPHVLVMRFDSDLSFANVGYFMEKIERYLERAKKRGNDTVVYVLDMAGVNQIDSSGVDALHQVQALCETQMIKWHFANTKLEIIRIMTRGGLIGTGEDQIHEDSFFHTLHDAVLQAKQVVKDRITHHQQNTGSTTEQQNEQELKNVVIDEQDDIMAA